MVSLVFWVENGNTALYGVYWKINPVVLKLVLLFGVASDIYTVLVVSKFRVCLAESQPGLLFFADDHFDFPVSR